MLNKDMLAELKPIISDPAWDIVIQRFKYILEQADKKLKRAKTFAEFLEARGEYQLASQIFEFINEPVKLADDGISRLASPQV